MKVKKLSIIIPCYNEEDYIKPTLLRVLRAKIGEVKKEIIVINDGSCDASESIIAKITKKYPIVTLVNHAINMGKGASIVTGLKRVTGDVVIIQDADCEYNPDDYNKLIKPFERDKADVVYGSRTLGIHIYGNRYSSLHFYLGGRLLTFVVNKLFYTRITDQPTGYKLFSKKLIPLLLKRVKEQGFSAEVEITAAISQAGIQIIEIPIQYTPRTITQGKKIGIADFIQSLLVALKYKRIFNGNKRI